MLKGKIKASVLIISSAFILSLTSCYSTQKSESVIQRTVALSFDDLPVARGHNLAKQQQVTKTLLASIETANVPVIGFVNEHKLGEAKAEYIALLKDWINAGHPIGNHTYQHPKFFDTSLE